MQVLAAKNVVHFDLKCDNILLDPLKGQEEHLWHPPSSQPTFRVVLADFGTARQYADSSMAHTRRWACCRSSCLWIPGGVKAASMTAACLAPPAQQAASSLTQCSWQHLHQASAITAFHTCNHARLPLPVLGPMAGLRLAHDIQRALAGTGALSLPSARRC